MPAPFRTRRRVEFADTDMVGLIHFSNFFRYMEAAEVDFLQALGWSVSMDWEGQHVSFPRVSASCDFVSPARFLDVLDVIVTVRNLGRKSVTYGFEFFKGEELVARGQLTAVCCAMTPANRFARSRYRRPFVKCSNSSRPYNGLCRLLLSAPREWERCPCKSAIYARIFPSAVVRCPCCAISALS
jgi:YbgC/YbaW family acyl-CoA thioester hydrolase